MAAKKKSTKTKPKVGNTVSAGAMAMKRMPPVET